jgi:hypothetical protein
LDSTVWSQLQCPVRWKGALLVDREIERLGIENPTLYSVHSTNENPPLGIKPLAENAPAVRVLFAPAPRGATPRTKPQIGFRELAIVSNAEVAFSEIGEDKNFVARVKRAALALYDELSGHSVYFTRNRIDRIAGLEHRDFGCGLGRFRSQPDGSPGYPTFAIRAAFAGASTLVNEYFT